MPPCYDSTVHVLQTLTNAMFIHECNEISFCEELGRAGLPIHHLHRGRLKTRPFLIHWDDLNKGGRKGKSVVKPELVLCLRGMFLTEVNRFGELHRAGKKEKTGSASVNSASFGDLWTTPRCLQNEVWPLSLEHKGR